MTHSESTEIALVGATTPAVVFQPGSVRSILDKLKADVLAVEIDISTPKGRKDCASLAYKVTRSKTALDDMGKQLTDQWRAQAETVHAERRIIRDELDALAEQVRAPLTEWEEAEKARVAAHENAIAQIDSWSGIPGEWTSSQIAARIAALDDDPLLSRDWQEFKARAQRAAQASLTTLKYAQVEAEKREAEAAEAKRLAEEEAERQRQEAARLQAEREAEIARQAAEDARLAAEAKAREEAAEAERKAEAERQRIVEEARQAEAAAAERERLAAERSAAALAAVEADRKAAAMAAVEKERLFREAELRAKEQAERAEQARVAAAEQAERDKQAAVEAERQRAEAERQRQVAEQADRERNVAHRRAVNREVLDFFVAAMKTVQPLDPPTCDLSALAKAIIESIAKGEIRYCKIIY